MRLGPDLRFVRLILALVILIWVNAQFQSLTFDGVYGILGKSRQVKITYITQIYFIMQILAISSGT